jgi:hypothetical protein
MYFITEQLGPKTVSRVRRDENVILNFESGRTRQGSIYTITVCNPLSLEIRTSSLLIRVLIKGEKAEPYPLSAF